MIKLIAKNLPLFNEFALSTLDEVHSFLRVRKEAAIDIETTRRYGRTQYASKVYQPGLDPYLSKVCMLQIGDGDVQYVIDARDFTKEEIAPLLQYPIRWVAHNAKFEYKHLKHNYGVELHEVRCTYVCERNLWNGVNVGFSLKDLAERYLDAKEPLEVDLWNDGQRDEDEIVIDKSTRLEFLNIEQRPFTNTQIVYGAQDVELAWKIYLLQREGRYVRGQGQYNPKALHRLENRVLKTFGNMELVGLPFDPVVWREIYETDSSKRYAELYPKLDEYVIKNIPKFTVQGFFGPECAVKWTSPQQVVKLLLHLGFCPLEFSKHKGKKVYSASAKALEFADVPEEHKEFVDTYLKFKEAEQACTMFGLEFLKNVHPITGRIHTNFNQVVNTGRPSSTNPNLLNIPAIPHRRAFAVPDGYKYVGLDFEAQELRVTADLSSNDTMIGIFKTKDADLHSVTAQSAYRKALNRPDLVVNKKLAGKDPFIKELREKGKTLNFRILYGASAHSLKKEFRTTEEEAQAMIDGYYDAYPGLREYFDTVFEDSKKKGYITTDYKLDRRRFMPYHSVAKNLESKQKLTKQEEKDLDSYYSSLRRLSQNNPIQGTSAGITKLAQILFENKSREVGLEAQLVVALYDELGAIARESDAERTMEVMGWAMREAGRYFLSQVELTTDGVITNHWKH